MEVRNAIFECVQTETVIVWDEIQEGERTKYVLA